MKKFVAPLWLKGVFFWCSLVMLFTLVLFQFNKRAVYARLLVENSVRPIHIAETLAPAFKLPQGPSAPELSSDTLRGSWVLLHFWATWCPPCREELPSLEILNRKLAGKLVTVAASVDEDWANVKNLFGQRQPSFKLVWDRGQKIASAYGTSQFPESFLISPKGKIVARFAGSRDWSTQEAIRYFETQVLNR